MPKSKNDYTFADIKAMLQQEVKKHKEEVAFQESIAKLDARKAEIKKKQNKNKFTCSLVPPKFFIFTWQLSTIVSHYS